MSDIINDYEEEYLGKYRKKKKKTVKKSDHKHEYVPALIRWDEKTICSGTRCHICGKIGDIKLFESEPCEDRPRVHRMLTQKEILAKYEGLEVYDYKTGEKVE